MEIVTLQQELWHASEEKELQNNISNFVVT